MSVDPETTLTLDMERVADPELYDPSVNLITAEPSLNSTIFPEPALAPVASANEEASELLLETTFKEALEPPPTRLPIVTEEPDLTDTELTEILAPLGLDADNAKSITAAPLLNLSVAPGFEEWKDDALDELSLTFFIVPTLCSPEIDKLETESPEIPIAWLMVRDVPEE